MSRMSPKAGTHAAGAKAIRFAITGALAAGLLAGCAGSSSKQLARAGDHAVRATAKNSRAVGAAEQTVVKSPNEAGARFALGQAYLEAGRFQSAATSFEDAIALGDASGRTQLSLVLALIGAGEGRAAVAVLDEARDTIPATDRGLALALAGETGRGVAILLDALRGGENSPKLRQNLAFAYALDGRWREARIAMAQDVPADRIDDRVGEWAMMSRPEDVQRRVASLLGVPVGVADPGQPAALALRAAPEDEQFAAASPVAPEAPPAWPAAAELPPIDAAPAPIPVPALALAPAPAPAHPEAEPTPASTSFAAAFAPQPGFVSQPVVQPIIARAPAPKSRSAARPAAPRVAAPAPVAAGTHLVQLGSFSSEENARRAWQIYTGRNPELRKFRMTITPVVVHGKNFWRVAAAGLDGTGATRLCSGLKSRGDSCFAYAVNRAPQGATPAFALAGAGTRARR